jgi:3-hydroxyacyl-CoA dehydrogenase
LVRLLLLLHTQLLTVEQKLVELIPGLQTAPETLERARAFALACGKTVTESKDVPGFVSNALLMPFINEVNHFGSCDADERG